MKFITAANARYKPIIGQWIQCLNKIGYSYEIYDLGGLGLGRPFNETNKDFQINGIYKTEFTLWNTKALFKPSVILDAIIDAKEPIVWLDADAWIQDSINEILQPNYDIGVAVRDLNNPTQKSASSKQYSKYNAGVIFLNPTDATKQFVREWYELTIKYGNDQYALNMLLLNNKTIKIHEFSYKFNDIDMSEDTKILHLRGGKFFPPQSLIQ